MKYICKRKINLHEGYIITEKNQTLYLGVGEKYINFTKRVGDKNVKFGLIPELQPNGVTMLLIYS